MFHRLVQLVADRPVRRFERGICNPALGPAPGPIEAVQGSRRAGRGGAQASSRRPGEQGADQGSVRPGRGRRLSLTRALPVPAGESPAVPGRASGLPVVDTGRTGVPFPPPGGALPDGAGPLVGPLDPAPEGPGGLPVALAMLGAGQGAPLPAAGTGSLEAQGPPPTHRRGQCVTGRGRFNRYG